MSGDACIESSRFDYKCSQSDIHTIYFKFVLNILCSVVTHVGFNYNNYKRSTNKSYKYHEFTFQVTEDEHLKWYTNGVKIVPPLKMTPVVSAFWLCDDGSDKKQTGLCFVTRTKTISVCIYGNQTPILLQTCAKSMYVPACVIKSKIIQLATWIQSMPRTWPKNRKFELQHYTRNETPFMWNHVALWRTKETQSTKTFVYKKLRQMQQTVQQRISNMQTGWLFNQTLCLL